MVTVSVLESSSGESAQRIAFILSFLLDKERTVKDFRFPKLNVLRSFPIRLPKQSAGRTSSTDSGNRANRRLAQRASKVAL